MATDKVTIAALTTGFLVTSPIGERDGRVVEGAHAEATLAGALQRAAICLGRSPAEAYMPTADDTQGNTAAEPSAAEIAAAALRERLESQDADEMDLKAGEAV